MSESKFGQRPSGKGVGFWQLPPDIAREYLGGQDLSVMNDPAKAADVTGRYLQELWRKYQKREFMYAIACYGLKMDQVGDYLTNLKNLPPDQSQDFWTLAQDPKIVPPGGAEKVIRFFAAGIVGENPTKYGLPKAMQFP